MFTTKPGYTTGQPVVTTPPSKSLTVEDSSSPIQERKPSLPSENTPSPIQERKPSLPGENTSPSKQPRRPSVSRPVVPAEAPKKPRLQELLERDPKIQNIAEILKEAETEPDAVLEKTLGALVRLREVKTGNNALQLLVIYGNYQFLNKLINLIKKKSAEDTIDHLRKVLSYKNDKDETIFHTIAIHAPSKYQEISIEYREYREILIMRDKTFGNTAMHWAARNEEDMNSIFLKELLKVDTSFEKMQNSYNRDPAQLKETKDKKRIKDIEEVLKQNELLEQEKEKEKKEALAKIAQLEKELRAKTAELEEKLAAANNELKEKLAAAKDETVASMTEKWSLLLEKQQKEAEDNMAAMKKEFEEKLQAAYGQVGYYQLIHEDKITEKTAKPAGTDDLTQKVSSLEATVHALTEHNTKLASEKKELEDKKKELEEQLAPLNKALEDTKASLADASALTSRQAKLLVENSEEISKLKADISTKDVELKELQEQARSNFIAKVSASLIGGLIGGAVGFVLGGPIGAGIGVAVGIGCAATLMEVGFFVGSFIPKSKKPEPKPEVPPASNPPQAREISEQAQESNVQAARLEPKPEAPAQNSAAQESIDALVRLRPFSPKPPAKVKKERACKLGEIFCTLFAKLTNSTSNDNSQRDVPSKRMTPSDT